MVGPPARDATPTGRPGSGPASFVAEPVDVGHIVVPPDGSPFAERALPVAASVAAGLGADIHLVAVVPWREGEEGCEAAIRYLDSVSRRQRATGWDVVQHDDVRQALSEAGARFPGRVACIATPRGDRRGPV